MSTVQIPATVEEAVESLNGLGALLTATEWERAAIVRAFCAPRELCGSASLPLSFYAFARLNIVGLRGYGHGPRRYYDRWESTGLPAPEPGKTVKLPEIPWEAFEPGEPKKRMAAELDKTIANPEKRAELIERLVADPEIREEVFERADEAQEQSYVSPSPKVKARAQKRAERADAADGEMGFFIEIAGADEHLAHALDGLAGLDLNDEELVSAVWQKVDAHADGLARLKGALPSKAKTDLRLVAAKG